MEDSKATTGDETVPAIDGRRRNPTTGTFSRDRAASHKWKYRHSANLSPTAFLCFMKVQLLLKGMEVHFTVSASTTMEFMYAIMCAYHDHKRLDLRNWNPTTRNQRPRVKVRGGSLRAIKEIEAAEMGGTEYLEERIKSLEHDLTIVRETRSDRAKRIPRRKDQESQDEG